MEATSLADWRVAVGLGEASAGQVGLKRTRKNVGLMVFKYVQPWRSRTKVGH